MGTDVFWMWDCKVCHGDNGFTGGSKYGLSKVLLRAGYNLASLMSRYAVSNASSGAGRHAQMLYFQAI